jgi:prolipoprotein diacylglyceryltransferase
VANPVLLLGIGPLSPHPFVLFVSAAVVLSYGVGMVVTARIGLPLRRFPGFYLWVLLAGVIGARIAYLVAHPDAARDGLLSILSLWQGGFSLVGGVIGGAVMLLALTRAHNQPFLPWADALLPGALLGLAVGMLGLPVNADGWGRPTRGPLFMRVASDLRPAAYAGSTHFEPIFAYEFALLVVLAALAALLLRRDYRMFAQGRGGYSSLVCVALLGLGIGALRPLTIDAMSDVAVLRTQVVCALLAAAALGVLLMRLYDTWRSARERQELLEVHQIWQARRQEFIDRPPSRRLIEVAVSAPLASEQPE